MKINGIGVLVLSLICSAAVADDGVVYAFMSKDGDVTRQGAAVAITPRWLLVPSHLLGKTNAVKTGEGWIEVEHIRKDVEFDIAVVTIPLKNKPVEKYARLADGDKPESKSIRVVGLFDGKLSAHKGKFDQLAGIKRVYWCENAKPGLSGGGVFDADGHCIGVVTGLLAQPHDGKPITNCFVALPSRRVWQFLNE